MVDWQSPESIALQYQYLLKSVHFTDGIYIWEWLTNLPYDLRILTGKKPFRWSMTLYLICRFATLATVVCDLAFFNITTRFSCEAVMLPLLITAYTSLGASPFLIMIRTIAIWNRQWVITPIAIALYLLNVSFLIWGVVEGPTAAWDSDLNMCVETYTDRNRVTVLVSFCSDVASLALALVGLWLRRSPGNFWKLVYHQGVMWMAFTIIFYAPPTVFLWLNFSAPMNLMLENPACIAMEICATRMYRSLTEFDDSDFTTMKISHTLQFARNPNLGLTDHSDIPMTPFGLQSEQSHSELEYEFDVFPQKRSRKSKSHRPSCTYSP